VADRRKTMVKEGFSQVFRRRPQDTREGPSGSGQLPVNPGPQATEAWTQGKQDKEADGNTGANPLGQTHCDSSSSKAGSYTPVTTFNRFAQLAESKRAEEVANKADQDMEERIRDSWDQESRIEDLANRKQQWHAAKYRKVGIHPNGSGTPSASTGEGSGPQGSERAGAEHHQQSSGSSARATRGPEAAGGPGAPEPPSATGGGDREERAAPPGRLAPGAGRQAGLPEPLAAPTVTGVGQGPVDHFSSGMADQALQVGAMPPALLLARPGSGIPGRATGRRALDPD
jgi:hypothetical protein